MLATSMTAADAARDPTTDPDSLKALAKDYPRLVAANPGASIDLLASLVPGCSDEVAGNPAVELGLLVGENILQPLPTYKWGYLLASPFAPEGLLTLAAETITRQSRYEVTAVRGLLANPRTPGPVIEALHEYVRRVKGVDEAVPVTEVRRHRNHPKSSAPADARQALEKVLAKLELDMQRSYGLPETVLSQTTLPEWAQVWLARANPVLLARYPAASKELIDELIAGEDASAAHELAARRDLAADQYFNLAERHKYDTSILFALLRNEVLPPVVLTRVVHLLGEGVGLAPLTHPNMTVAALDHLAEHRPEWLSLARVQEARRWAQAEPRPPEPRRRITHRWGSDASLEQIETIREQRLESLLVLVALSPDLTGVVARELAGTPHPVVRLALALNSATPEPVLERLRGDGDRLVAAAAAPLAGLRVDRP